MALSQMSKQCILTALLVFVNSLYYVTVCYDEFSVIEALRDKENDKDSWSNPDKLLAKLKSDTTINFIYFMAAIILVPIFIVGVVKRNIPSMIPLLLLLPIYYIYNQEMFYSEEKWISIYLTMITTTALLANPVRAVFCEIIEEKKAKLYLGK
ncbi:uncharacterized protein LOC106093999 [Stomoxys calcitrans]|uniref:uncharacterized protein LOC106093999 n=1 Tax=Stomoxys calcitrans TaxID=35570 RepID=UPI0027E229BA|nr:uncharacterized protein LOC106093999 [Stomoxys calcitrans]